MNHSTQLSRRDEVIVVVPCFNEAKRLQPQTFGDFLECSPNVTLVFVDDGSTDDTPLVLEQLRQRYSQQICTLRLGSNVGKGEAVRRGIRVALRRRPSMVGYWDADLATPLEAIPQLCNVLRERPGLVLVMGSRVALLGRRIQRSGMRHYIGRIFATTASLVLGLPVYDTQCGAKLFRVTPDINTILDFPFRARWVFDVEILARMIAMSQSTASRPAHELIFEYPLDQWQDMRGSRLKPFDFLVAAYDLVALYWRFRRHGAIRRSQPADVTAPSGSPLPDAPRREAA